MRAPTSIGVVAHYNLLERLEPAGPGELYRARDTRHGRTVIVRLLPPSASSEEQEVLRQAGSLTTLSHQNVITLYSCGLHDGRVYVAFEHVPGRSLRAEMSGRPMNARRAVELATQTADAVAEAHALGFLHGGLSPDAIGITAKGHAKVAAFHFATMFGFANDSASLADYESPEEARGERPDDRSDVYSIGAVLYETLTTRRPMHRGAAAPSASNRMVPKELDDIVLKAVAPNAERRYQSAAALASALRGVLPTLELPEVPAALVKPDAATNTRHVVLLAAVILIALAAAWWFMRS